MDHPANHWERVWIERDLVSSVLITGGAGFIGSAIGRTLAKRGHQVRILDDLSNSSEAAIADINAELTIGDIRNSDLVIELAEGVDWIFHQAALVSVPGSIEDPIGCYEINVAGTLSVLEAARHVGVKRVVLASSAAVYGESGVPVSEDAPKQPLSPYAASKWAMEQAALMYKEVYGLPTVCLRYFNVYGPRQRPDSMYAAVIPAFVNAMILGEPTTIYGDGEQRRDFVHVDDVVRANLLAAEGDETIGKVLNISGGGAVTINELAGILQEIIADAPAPVHGPSREGDIYFSEAIIYRAWEALEYRPEVALVEGLRSTVEWFRQERLQTPQ
ncbi:MAG: SDR family oxidoreductase [Anaerolineae bacterium]|nr:MAG: SDR family oxidoreductase [Anaerolineae bacterium]